MTKSIGSRHPRVYDSRSIRKSKFSPCAGTFPTYFSWIRMVNSDLLKARAAFLHWPWLILIASILCSSLAARASDQQPKPNPTSTKTPAPTSAVSDSGVQVLNVKTYGAVGNGSTDDTAAIRSAITAASATGGVVFFPPGVFVLPVRLTCQSLNNVSFQGSGKSNTILKSAIPATPSEERGTHNAEFFELR